MIIWIFNVLGWLIHVFTDHKQVQELHRKNQLNRGYNKLPKKKILQKINKAFLFNKVFKKLDHSKVFVQFISMSIDNNIGEYNTKTFIYISCTIVFRYFVYTGFKNVLASCLLYFLILCAELYVLMLENNYTLSYFYKCVHIISFF